MALIFDETREAQRPRTQTRRELMASAKGILNMHPAVVSWWRAHAGGCGHAGDSHCGGPGHHRGGGHGSWVEGEGPGVPDGFGGGDGFGGFGVRRPLRFLAYKLQLNERQVSELARILDELKTERAQGEVDRRRTLSAFADAVSGETFDEARAKEAADLRVATAERLRSAVTTALSRIHALLDNDQRGRLSYLIRTGTLVL
jgi:Spy/CpxP family protein refolding chaperone